MPLRQGVQELQDAINRAGQQGDRTPANYFSWKDGEVKILRFLTDADKIFVVNLHNYVLCPDGKHHTFVCRKDLDAEASCELCNMEGSRRSEMGFGVAVLREEVTEMVDGRRKVVGYRDYTEEFDAVENGRPVKKIRPHVGIVRQSMTNFWMYVDEIYQRYGSLRERDLEVKRRGGDKSTVYVIYPSPEAAEIEHMDPWVSEAGEQMPGRYDKFVPDLKAMLEGMGTEAYYKRFLHGEGGQAGQPAGQSAGPSGPSASAARPAPAGPPLDEQSEFERLRRIQAEQEAQREAAAAQPSYTASSPASSSSSEPVYG